MTDRMGQLLNERRVVTPRLLKGEGRLITGLYQHQSAITYVLKIASEAYPIGVTGNHPIWSEDRQEFVRADVLQVDERLLSLTAGVTTATSIIPRGPPEPVFNLEVDVDHVYNVGHSRLLVHNSGFDYVKPALIGEYMPRARAAAASKNLRAWPARNWDKWVENGVEFSKNRRWLRDQIRHNSDIYSLGKTPGSKFERGNYYREEVKLLLEEGYRRRYVEDIYHPEYGSLKLYKWIIPSE